MHSSARYLIQNATYPFNKYLLSTNYKPGITVVAGDTVVNKTRSVLALMEFIFYRGRGNLII